MVRPDPLERLKASRRLIAGYIETPRFIGFITALILINAVTLGMETDAGIMAAHGQTLYLIDKLILIVFTIELALKFYAYRFAFFRSGWNVFDLIIVAIAWVPANGAFAILRALRILRILRLISVVPQMRRVISAIGHSIPGMTAVIGVLCLLFYVSAVLATKLFGHHHDPQMQEWFGSIGASAYTLFQIMTLESWSMGIVRPTMEIFPWAWIFFVPFIIVTSFAVLNLFIGIIVDAMQTAQKDRQKSRHGDEAQAKSHVPQNEIQALHERFDSLQRDLAALQAALEKRTTGRSRH